MRLPLAVFIALWSAAPDKPVVERLAEEAERARDLGHLRSSVALLRRAFAIEPLPVLQNNLGRALVALGRYREAADSCRAVIDDPRAEAELVARNKARLAELAPKLTRAWAQVDAAVIDAHMLVDGASAKLVAIAEENKEIELDPGPHVFEYQKNGGEVLLRFADLLRADTSSIALEVAGNAKLVIPTSRFRVRLLRINGYEVRAPMTHLERIYVAPGPHVVEVELEDATTIARRVTVAAGQDVLLSNLLVELTPVRAEVTALTHAEATEERSVGPYVAAGAGVVLVAVGAVLEVGAASDRRRVRDAIGSQSVVMDLTMAEAVALEDRADDQATWAAAAITVGAVAIGAGIVWWLLE